MTEKPMNALEESFKRLLVKRGEMDDGRQPKAILERLEANGVILAMVDGRLKRLAGTLSDRDRDDVTACRPEIVGILCERERRKAASPWNDSTAAIFLERARGAFGDLWDDLHAKHETKKRTAAIAVLTDSISMLAEAQRDRNLDEFTRKSDYVVWVCETIRSNLR